MNGHSKARQYSDQIRKLDVESNGTSTTLTHQSARVSRQLVRMLSTLCVNYFLKILYTRINEA